MNPRRRVERTSTRSDETRGRIIEATQRTIAERGFASATTQVIAEQAGVAQGVLFYHFGTMNDLFVEVVRASNASRLERYRDVLDSSTDIAGLLANVFGLFQEDKASGHVDAMAELVAGAGAVPALREELQRQTTIWFGLVEDALIRLLSGSPVEPLLPKPRQLVVVIGALYLGSQLLDHLNPEIGMAEAMGAIAERLAALLSLLGGTQ